MAGRPSPGKGNEEMEEQLHRENEAMLSALSSSVLQMKSVAGNLNREAESQNKLLNSLREAFSGARMGVGNSIRGVGEAMGRHGLKHTLVCGTGLFIVLYLVYAVFLR